MFEKIKLFCLAFYCDVALFFCETLSRITGSSYNEELFFK